MKRKKFYLVSRKGKGCYPYCFSSQRKAEIFASFMKDSCFDSNIEFAVIPCIPDFVGSIGAVSYIRNMYSYE